MRYLGQKLNFHGNDPKCPPNVVHFDILVLILYQTTNFRHKNVDELALLQLCKTLRRKTIRAEIFEEKKRNKNGVRHLLALANDAESVGVLGLIKKN